MSERSQTQFDNAEVAHVGSELLLRKCDCGSHTIGGDCETCRNKGAMLQRQASGQFDHAEVPTSVSSVLSSPGQPMDPSTRSFMESRFGHDFSQVRLHTDAGAAESAQEVNAKAYTIGRDVVFGRGQYAPQTVAGKQVLAHELTHVVQQREGFNQNVLQRLPKEVDPHHEEAMDAAERGLYNEYKVTCRDVSVLSRLEKKEGPITPLEKVRRLEDRLKFIRMHFEAKRGKPNIVHQAIHFCVKNCVFGDDYVLTSEEGELASTRCELSEARWQAFVFGRYGQIPGVRSLHFGKVPWIPDPRVCFNSERMRQLQEDIEAGKDCHGEVRQTKKPSKELIL
jgi:hypothetical protein